jgi:hypothetical protein
VTAAQGWGRVHPGTYKATAWRSGAFRQTDWNDSLSALVVGSPALWDQAFNVSVAHDFDRFVKAAAAGLARAGSAHAWGDAQRAAIRSHRVSVEADLRRLAERARAAVRLAQKELGREMRGKVRGLGEGEEERQREAERGSERGGSWRGRGGKWISEREREMVDPGRRFPLSLSLSPPLEAETRSL